ncbi:MAG TPA: hypothetical protein PKH07_15110, partial [bacterium]|nr:hypothetical protein [bacterium]
TFVLTNPNFEYLGRSVCHGLYAFPAAREARLSMQSLKLESLRLRVPCFLVFDSDSLPTAARNAAAQVL